MSRSVGPIQLFTDKPLGFGSTGNVFQGILKISVVNCNQLTISQSTEKSLSKNVAVKVIPHAFSQQNQVTRYLFECQKLALNTLTQHDSIIKCLSHYEDSENSYFAMELLQLGTLKEYLETKKTLSENEAIHILYKSLEGLQVISRQGFVHRDIKPANIMIRTKQNQKFIEPVIIDFGFCQHHELIEKPSMFYNVGSPTYMAPESYNETVYSEKSDLWSLGVVFYEMLIGQPIEKGNEIDLFFQNPSQLIKRKLQNLRFTLTRKTQQILKYILNPNCNERPTVKEALEFVKSKKNLRFPLKRNIKSCNYEFKILKSNKSMEVKPREMRKESTTDQQSNENVNSSIGREKQCSLQKKLFQDTSEYLQKQRSQDRLLSFKEPFYNFGINENYYLAIKTNQNLLHKKQFSNFQRYVSFAENSSTSRNRNNLTINNFHHQRSEGNLSNFNKIPHSYEFKTKFHDRRALNPQKHQDENRLISSMTSNGFSPISCHRTPMPRVSIRAISPPASTSSPQTISPSMRNTGVKYFHSKHDWINSTNASANFRPCGFDRNSYINPQMA